MRPVLALVLFAGITAAGYLAWQSNINREAAEAVAGMPSVIIQGRAKDALSFGSWAKDSVYLRSNMTLNPGVPVERIRYTAVDASGVKLDEGPVEYPGWASGTGSLKERETVKASILIKQEKDTKKVVVDVD